MFAMYNGVSTLTWSMFLPTKIMKRSSPILMGFLSGKRKMTLVRFRLGLRFLRVLYPFFSDICCDLRCPANLNRLN